MNVVKIGWKLHWISIMFSDIYSYNSWMRSIFYCLSVIYFFQQCHSFLCIGIPLLSWLLGIWFLRHYFKLVVLLFISFLVCYVKGHFLYCWSKGFIRECKAKHISALVTNTSSHTYVGLWTCSFHFRNDLPKDIHGIVPFISITLSSNNCYSERHSLKIF